MPGNLLDAGGLREEAKARTRIALRSELLGRGDLKRIAGIAKSNAILSHGNGEADPVKLAAGLWREFHRRGGEVISLFEAEELDESRTGVKIKSRDGRQITAKHIVLCSGYEMPKFFWLKGLRIISTWALATKPQARKLWSGRHLIWEAAEPYLYFRTTSHGRIIAGGEDENFAGDEKRDGLLKAKTKRIGMLARRIFPGIDFEPDYAWSGSFGESETGLPVIGLMPGFRRSYCVMGFGGNGITFSMLAAQLICREINGISDPDADLFRP